jgi:hypothetical protein
MNVITDYIGRQLFLSRDEDKATPPLVYHIDDNSVQVWSQYPGYQVVAWHAGAGLLVLNSQWITGGRKLVTRLVVMRPNTQEEVYSTNRHMYYHAVFNSSGSHLLLEAYGQKPAWVDISTGEIVAELKPELRLVNGTFNHHKNIFYFPPEKKKVWLEVDGATFTGTMVKSPFADKVYNMHYIAPLQQFLLLTEGNVLIFCDDQFNPLWERNFKAMGDNSGHIIGSDLLVTEDEQLVCISASSTQGNSWGADFVLDLKTGEPVNIIQGVQYRGRITGGYFNRQVLLYTMQLMHLETGVVEPFTLPDFLPGFK